MCCLLHLGIAKLCKLHEHSLGSMCQTYLEECAWRRHCHLVYSSEIILGFSHIILEEDRRTSYIVALFLSCKILGHGSVGLVTMEFLSRPSCT